MVTGLSAALTPDSPHSGHSNYPLGPSASSHYSGSGSWRAPALHTRYVAWTRHSHSPVNASRREASGQICLTCQSDAPSLDPCESPCHRSSSMLHSADAQAYSYGRYCEVARSTGYTHGRCCIASMEHRHAHASWVEILPTCAQATNRTACIERCTCRSRLSHEGDRHAVLHRSAGPTSSTSSDLRP